MRMCMENDGNITTQFDFWICVWHFLVGNMMIHFCIRYDDSLVWTKCGRPHFEFCSGLPTGLLAHIGHLSMKCEARPIIVWYSFCSNLMIRRLEFSRIPPATGSSSQCFIKRALFETRHLDKQKDGSISVRPFFEG